MEIEEFALERTQSLYENIVPLNMSDSGVHPFDLQTLLHPGELQAICELELGYGWTNGSVELRTAITALYGQEDPEMAIATNGSAEANFLMVMTLLDPGDELIVLVPNYMQIVGWARGMGVHVVTAPLRLENDWRPDVAEIERLITPRTRAISLCNPNNPTGSLMQPAEMQALIDVARRHGLYLHADEIYKGSELNQDEGPSFGDLYEKAIVTNGLSKAMAMPGLRLGWLYGPKDFIARAWHRKDYTTITTGTISEYIGSKVLQPDRRRQILGRSKAILRSNLALLTEWVAQHDAVFSFRPPQAGGMAFLRYTMPINSTDLVMRMMKAKGVFPVPGDAFGVDGHIRIGIGTPADHLLEGLNRIGDYLTENNYR